MDLVDYNNYRVKGYSGGLVVISTLVAAPSQAIAIKATEEHYHQYIGPFTWGAKQLTTKVRVAVSA